MRGCPRVPRPHPWTGLTLCNTVRLWGGEASLRMHPKASIRTGELHVAGRWWMLRIVSIPNGG